MQKFKPAINSNIVADKNADEAEPTQLPFLVNLYFNLSTEGIPIR
jgi:hypothetical protein